MNRREFLTRVAVGTAVLSASAPRPLAFAQTASPYPDWIQASPKPPKRGGLLAYASAWDPPVLDPRLTQSIGLFQIAGLTSNRLLRYAFADEATGYSDLSLKGDLAESWQGSPDQRIWTFKLRRGVKWQNVPPLKGRELTAADVKYCFEAYAKEGSRRSRSRKSRTWRRPTRIPCASTSRRPTRCSRRTSPNPLP